MKANKKILNVDEYGADKIYMPLFRISNQSVCWEKIGEQRIDAMFIEQDACQP